jgi:hypothetical protein
MPVPDSAHFCGAGFGRGADRPSAIQLSMPQNGGHSPHECGIVLLADVTNAGELPATVLERHRLTRRFLSDLMVAVELAQVPRTEWIIIRLINDDEAARLEQCQHSRKQLCA